MNNIYLLYSFNNYINRKVKRLETLADYKTAVQNNYLQFDNVINFNPADGINTSHIFNLDTTTAVLQTNMPDYMIVVDDNNTILQRWFVIKSNRTRSGQYDINLHRDVIAECWNNIQDAPIFVKKGILGQRDPMIYNKEGMTFNQIKQSEELIKDDSQCAWIVGYMDRSDFAAAEGETWNPSQSFVPVHRVPDISVNDITTWHYYRYTDISGQNARCVLITKQATVKPEYSYQRPGATENAKVIAVLPSGQAVDEGLTIVPVECPWIFSRRYKPLPYFREFYKQYNYETLITNLNTVNFAGNSRYNEYKGLDGKIIKDTATGKIYQITFKEEVINVSERYESNIVFQQLDNARLATNEMGLGELTIGWSSDRYYKVSVDYVMGCFALTDITNAQSISYKLPNTRKRLMNDPYTMFCMPYGKFSILGSTVISKDFSALSSMVAADICNKFSGNYLYDIQILPYCPVHEFLTQTGQIDIQDRGLVEDSDFSYIHDGGVVTGCIFWATDNKRSFAVQTSIAVTDYKLDNETKMCRIVSPNYNGQFEFSAAMNGGVDFMKIDFTYRPYQSYIHVAPNYKNLYGNRPNDAEGLICNGDFSFPQTSDAWETYKRNNVNYLNAFNRQIENLNVNQNIARIRDAEGVISSTVQGAANGAMMGGGTGAIIGGATSFAKSAVNIGLNEWSRQETVDYTKDMYNYQLGSVKARADSLNNVGAMTNNNKLFPFVEYYAATEEEVEALKRNINYNGMTVGRVGTIGEFKTNEWLYSNGWNYFQGDIIWIDIPDQDWNFTNQVRNELNRGIFISYDGG